MSCELGKKRKKSWINSDAKPEGRLLPMKSRLFWTKPAGKISDRVICIVCWNGMDGARKCRDWDIRRQQIRSPAMPQKINSGVMDARSKIWNQTGRLMFKDEAGFGRINNSKRCWCSPGQQPFVLCHHMQEYRYTFGAVEPLSGESFFLTIPNCDTNCTNISVRILQTVSPMTLFCWYVTEQHGTNQRRWNAQKHTTPFHATISSGNKPHRTNLKGNTAPRFSEPSTPSLNQVVDRFCETIRSLSAETI